MVPVGAGVVEVPARVAVSVEDPGAVGEVGLNAVVIVGVQVTTKSSCTENVTPAPVVVPAQVAVYSPHCVRPLVPTKPAAVGYTALRLTVPQVVEPTVRTAVPDAGAGSTTVSVPE